MSEGHPNASAYPLSVLWLEADIARERVNRNHATTASILSTVITASYPGGRQAAKNLTDLLRKLNHG